MLKQRYSRILTLVTVCFFVMLASTVEAKGGKDGKRKSDDASKGKTVLQDSLEILESEDIAHVEDTLVFEDWEKPGGGSDDIGEGTQSTGGSGFDDNSGDINKDELSQFTSACDLTMKKIQNSLKKEYIVDFKIYPNPTVERLNIVTESMPDQVIINDLGGKQHLVDDYSPSINVSMLPMGTYFIQLVYYDHVETRKFIKR